MGGGGGGGGGGKKALVSEINVTPFVDILLVLLIIFMVTAPSMTRSIGVELPKERLNAPAPVAPEEVEFFVIGLAKDSQILFEKKTYESDAFYDQFPQLTGNREPEKIFIQSDRTVQYERLLHLMVYLKNLGHENVGLVFEEE
jgi:biopolymer transport protein TolR